MLKKITQRSGSCHEHHWYKNNQLRLSLTSAAGLDYKFETNSAPLRANIRPGTKTERKEQGVQGSVFWGIPSLPRDKYRPMLSVG
jgi:hypothetical protein